MNSREKAFLTELAALMEKHGVTMEAKDEYPGYPECGEEIHVRFEAASEWDAGGNKIHDALNADLGTYADADTLRKMAA